MLHVGPKVGTQGTEPSVRLSEVATSSKLSLLAYEQRFHPSANQVHVLLDQVIPYFIIYSFIKMSSMFSRLEKPLV